MHRLLTIALCLILTLNLSAEAGGYAAWVKDQRPVIVWMAGR